MAEEICIYSRALLRRAAAARPLPSKANSTWAHFPPNNWPNNNNKKTHTHNSGPRWAATYLGLSRPALVKRKWTEKQLKIIGRKNSPFYAKLLCRRSLQKTGRGLHWLKEGQTDPSSLAVSLRYHKKISSILIFTFRLLEKHFILPLCCHIFAIPNRSCLPYGWAYRRRTARDV